MAKPNTLIQADLALLRDAPYHDCEIKCEGHETSFPAHKSIICSRNRYFAAALGENFHEAATSSIIMDDIPFAVEGLLVYNYTLQYPEAETIKTFTPSTSMWHYHFEIFKIADKRQESKLRFLAGLKLSKLSEQSWNDECVIGIIPELWSIPSCQDSILCHDILDGCVLHHKSLADRADYATMLLENADFLRDLMLSFSRRLSDQDEAVKMLQIDIAKEKERVAELTQKVEMDEYTPRRLRKRVRSDSISNTSPAYDLDDFPTYGW